MYLCKYLMCYKMLNIKSSFCLKIVTPSLAKFLHILLKRKRHQLTMSRFLYKNIQKWTRFW